jgi:hypothetical protein
VEYADHAAQAIWGSTHHIRCDCYHRYLQPNPKSPDHTARYRRMSFIGALLAIVLIGVEIVLVSKYVVQTRMLRDLVKAEHGSRQRREVATTGSTYSLGTLCGSRLSRRSLSYRLSFVTGRFASHAPQWQYVIWARQLLLTLVMLAPEMVGSVPVDDLDDNSYNESQVIISRNNS